MAEEIAFENGRISKYQGLVTLTLDRVMLHTVVHHSVIDLYLHAKFHRNRRNFLWTNGRTCVRYGRTDWHLRRPFLSRLKRVDIKTDTAQKKRSK